MMIRYWLRSMWYKWIIRGSFQPKKPIFFLHIPKTAGTSFRNMIFRSIDQKYIFPNFEDFGKNEGHYYSLDDFENFLARNKRKIYFYSGHYPMLAGSNLPQDVHYYVFLREPISRTISNLHHFQIKYPENKHLALSEVFDKYQSHLVNLQTRFLAFSKPEHLNHYYGPIISEEFLEMAKENLRNCHFIGITERFSESIIAAERLLNTKLGNQLKRNVTPTNKKLSIEKSLEKRIKASLNLDIQLYQYALELFDEQQNRLSQIP